MPKTKNTIIAVLLAILAAAAAFSLLFYKVWRENKIIAAAEGKMSEQSKKDAELRFMGRMLEKTAEKRNLISGAFLASNDVASFIEEVENLARSEKLSVNIDRIDIDKSIANGEKINIKLTTKGKWANERRFFGLLESMPYGVEILSLNLNKNSKTAPVNASKSPAGAETSPEDWSMSAEFSVLKKK